MKRSIVQFIPRFPGSSVLIPVKRDSQRDLNKMIRRIDERLASAPPRVERNLPSASLIIGSYSLRGGR